MRDVAMSSIRAIDRAIDVLQAFTFEKPALTLTEISKVTQIPKNTVYRIMYTLERRGYVQFDQHTVTYKAGLKCIEIGFLLSSVLDVLREAEEHLIDLHAKTRQTVLMAIKGDDYILYVSKKEHPEGLKFSSLVGQRRPFIYGTLGPVLLAYLPDDQIERILQTPVSRHTPYTVTDKQAILQRLLSIRKDGYYMESNETNVGVTGIGTPVFNAKGEAEAAIGIVGPSIQLDDRIEEAKQLIVEASGKISAQMRLLRR